MFIKKVHKFNDNNLEFTLYATKPDEGVITIGNSDITFRFDVNKEGAKKIAREFSHYAEECFKEEFKLDELLTEESALDNVDKFNETLAMLMNEIQPKISKFNNKKAKIIYCKDNSGSMGSYERFAAKAFSTWNYGMLSNLYNGNIQQAYVSFNSEASAIYDADEFFSKGETGGTIVSSGLSKVNDIINSTDLSTDIFVFLISDGDNLTSDSDKVVRVLGDIQRKAKHVSYFEINQYMRSSTLMSSLKNLDLINFTKQVYRDRNDMLPILNKLWAQINQ